jgi:hypothetical protein
MPSPSVEDATTYLGETSWGPEAIASAYDAEEKAQGRACKIPLNPAYDPDDQDSEQYDYPADLIEALYRRVAHNLALRALPLGVQATLSDSAVATTRVGGLDAEVRRLEAPFRRLVVA